jgi:hypothetical protein
MGGASVAMPGEINAVFANPALLSSITRRQALIGYQLLPDGVWCAPIGFAAPNKRSLGGGSFAFMLQALSSGKVKVIDIRPDGEPLYTNLYAHDEYFTPSFSYGRTFLNSRLYTGITLKGLYHRVYNPPEIYSSKAIAIDLGIQYRWFSDRLIVGAVIRNAGVELQQFKGEDAYPLPILVEVGFSYVPRYLSAVRIAADVNKIRSEYPNIKPGIEITLYPKVLFIRFGYMFSTIDFREVLKNFIGDEDPNYIKSNWNTLSTGIGVHTHIQKVFVKIDFALQFRSDWIYTSPVISAVVDF